MATNTITGEVCKYPPWHPDHILNPSVYYAESGWQMFDEQQQADHDAREASAAAAAVSNATAEASLPDKFEHSIVIPDALGHWQLLYAVTNGSPAITLQVSSSPLTKDQFNAMASRNIAAFKAKVDAAKSAKQKGNIQDRLAAIEAILGI